MVFLWFSYGLPEANPLVIIVQSHLPKLQIYTAPRLGDDGPNHLGEVGLGYDSGVRLWILW